LRSYTSLAACGWGAVAALVFCLVGTCGRAVRELTSFATPIMAVVMAAFLVFLLIILQIYNSSLILENVDVDWTSFTF
jgi:hypothetical protein